MSTFTVVEVDTVVSFTVGGSPQSDFEVPFPFDDSDDLRVLVAGTTATYTIAESTPVDGFLTGATITLDDPAPAGAVVQIERMTKLRQETLFPTAGRFPIAQLNREVSRTWMAIQDLARDLLGVADRVTDIGDDVAEGSPYGAVLYLSNAGGPYEDDQELCAYVVGMDLTLTGTAYVRVRDYAEEPTTVTVLRGRTGESGLEWVTIATATITDTEASIVVPTEDADLLEILAGDQVAMFAASTADATLTGVAITLVARKAAA